MKEYLSRGPLIKLLNLFIILYIEDLLKNENSIELEQWLFRLERIFKLFVLTSENNPDKDISIHK